MYQALYRSFRPDIFEEVLGQEHIVKILKNQIKNDKIGHAYLFCGTRGTGKTTLARILAKGVNCLTEDKDKPCGECYNCLKIKSGTHMDVIEIDAASNNGVDNIREINESVSYPPVAGKYKVYIIDEVHMLSNSAFNALLKTLEEPPEHVIFVMATTEPERVPRTILSRCLRLDFKRIPEDIIKKGMDDICSEIGVEISKEALTIIAKNADGSVRDGLSILDQCITSGENKISRDDVLETIGAAGEEEYVELTDLILSSNAGAALIKINELINMGKDEKQMFKDWIAHYRNLMMVSCLEIPQDMMNLSMENISRLKKQAESMELSDINKGIILLSKMALEAKWSTQARILLEVAAVNLAMGYDKLYEEDESVKREKKQKINKSGKTGKAEVTDIKVEKKTDIVTADKKDEKPENKSDESLKPEMSQISSEARRHKLPENSAETKLPENKENKFENIDLEELWVNVLKRGEKSLNMVRFMSSGASIRNITNGEVVMFIRNDATERAIKSNENVLKEIFKELTGLNVDIICKNTNVEPEPEKRETIEEQVNKLEKTLGIKIDIE